METFSLDTQIQRIRAIVEEMQKGVTDFDRQVALFKEGTQLIKACNQYLQQSELDIQQLIDNELKAFELPK